MENIFFHNENIYINLQNFNVSADEQRIRRISRMFLKTSIRLWKTFGPFQGA